MTHVGIPCKFLWIKVSADVENSMRKLHIKYKHIFMAMLAHIYNVYNDRFLNKSIMLVLYFYVCIMSVDV